MLGPGYRIAGTEGIRIGMSTKENALTRGARLPRDLMGHPITVPDDRQWPSPRVYGDRLRGQAVTITVEDAHALASFHAPPSALVALVGVTTAEVYAAKGWKGDILEHDGDMSMVAAQDFNALLGRDQRREAYERTRADLDALFRLAVTVETRGNTGPFGERVVDRYRILTAVGEMQPDRIVGGHPGGYAFRWQASPWLARQIAGGDLSKIPLDVMTGLDSGLAQTLLPWVISLSWRDSVRRDGGKHKEGLASVWQKFPTAPDRPFASQYRRRVDAALKEIKAEGVVTKYEWDGDGWNQVLKLSLNPEPPNWSRWRSVAVSK